MASQNQAKPTRLYQPVEGNLPEDEKREEASFDGSDSFLNDEDFLLEKPFLFQITKRSLLFKLGWVAQVLFFFASIAILIVASKLKPTDIQCAKQLSPYCELKWSKTNLYYVPVLLHW